MFNYSGLSNYDNYDDFGEQRYDPELVSSYTSELLRGKVYTLKFSYTYTLI